MPDAIKHDVQHNAGLVCRARSRHCVQYLQVTGWDVFEPAPVKGCAIKLTKKTADIAGRVYAGAILIVQQSSV